ncbi:hypothetical protein PHMEG_00018824 [Phytophthora megakarya]|uniref:M96 mating-specific protein n=1 Tax=Phytophthora megakarya TaxID=4795 RepID=A0A225VTE4_9STRA|nr:hypothetical protein PHMEG_00018824 [Phytophthora megakarya]
MTDCNAEFLAEITRFLHDDELCGGIPVEEPRFNQSVVVFNQESSASNSSSEEEQTKSSRVTGTKRSSSDESTAAKRRQIYRQRAKSERESLRYEVAQLSTRLSVLMVEFRKKNSNRTNNTNSISMWKTIALCRQTERQQAEDERNKLQSAVETQRFFIQQFRMLLLQQLSQNPICDQVVQHCTVEQKKDRVIFRAQMAELDANYSCSDDIFSANEVALMGEKVIKEIATNPDGTVKCVQYRGMEEYPFEFQPARASVWEIYHFYNQQKDREVYTDVTNPDNTYAFKFRVTRQLAKDTSVSLLVRLVIRRYSLKNQMVIVWRTFTEGEGIFSGMHCSDSGWTRVRSFETGTTMEMYVKLVPMSFRVTPARFHEAVSMRRQLGQLNEACIHNGMASLSRDDNWRA